MFSASLENFRIRRIIYSYFFDYGDKLLFSFLYDVAIVIIAIFSITPLIFTDAQIEQNSFLSFLFENEFIWLTIFTIDYALRWFTADFRLHRGFKSFLLYPFTFWAILDLIAILPGWLGLVQFQALITIRLFKIVRVFPKVSDGVSFIFRAIVSEWKILLFILITLVFFVLIGSIFIFQIEYEDNPEINTYWDAIWFVFITISTIGYGDISPVTDMGKGLTIIFAMIGIALIALITATVVSGFNRELKKRRFIPELNEPLLKTNPFSNLSNLNEKSKLSEKEIKFNIFFFRSTKKEIIEHIRKHIDLIDDQYIVKSLDTYYKDELIKIYRARCNKKINIDNEEIINRLDRDEIIRYLIKNNLNFKYRSKKETLINILIEHKKSIKWI